MRFRLPLFVFLLALIISSCSPTLRFDQTCITCIKSQRIACTGDNCPATFIVNGNCLVTIVETGENIYLNSILEKEQIPAKDGIPVSIAKMDGKIYITANNFKNLWILYPKVPNEAKFSSIKLPKENITLPVFDFSDGKLRLTAGNYDKMSYILIDDNNWIIYKETKAGE